MQSLLNISMPIVIKVLTLTALPRLSDILWVHGFILFCICRLSLGNVFAHRIKWNASNGTSFKIYTLPPQIKCTVSLMKARFWQTKSILYMADEQVYVVGTFLFMVNLDKLVPRFWHVEIQRIHCKIQKPVRMLDPFLYPMARLVILRSLGTAAKAFANLHSE